MIIRHSLLHSNSTNSSTCGSHSSLMRMRRQTLCFIVTIFLFLCVPKETSICCMYMAVIIKKIKKKKLLSECISNNHKALRNSIAYNMFSTASHSHTCLQERLELLFQNSWMHVLGHDVPPKPASHTVIEHLHHLGLPVWHGNNTPLLLHDPVCTVKRQKSSPKHPLRRPSFGVFLAVD